MWDLKRVLLLEGTTTNHHGFNSIHFSFLFGEKKLRHCQPCVFACGFALGEKDRKSRFLLSTELPLTIYYFFKRGNKLVEREERRGLLLRWR